jgi:GrpB-like predicted nucleotidyltransferase (UPF0157 family)
MSLRQRLSLTVEESSNLRNTCLIAEKLFNAFGSRTDQSEINYGPGRVASQSMSVRSPTDIDASFDAPVEIAPYDAAWPAMFEAERSLLESVLAPWMCASIEHIGSTAVPGLPAKPIIDIMGPVRDLQACRRAICALLPAGYCYFPYKPDVMLWFCKPSPEMRTHHLHLVPFESALWKERLVFRDALRSNQTLVAQYTELKVGLAERFRFDREAYTEGKTAFVDRVLSSL